MAEEISGQSNRISGLAERPHFYFLIHNAEIEEFRKKHNLPYSDNSYYDEKGNLVNQPLTKEELKEYNFIKKYEISLYSPNQIVIDTDKDVKNDLEQKGVYRYSLSGAGFNSICQSKFVGTWEKTSIKDTLYIKDNFIWQRKKFNNENLFYLWEGEYTFAENIIIFSLLKKGYKIIKDLFSFSEKTDVEQNKMLFNDNNENFKDNLLKFYGLMMGPIPDLHGKEHIYSAFKDDTKSDFTNFYEGDTNTDILIPGGRGELKRGIINLENKNIVDYVLGSNSNYGKSTLKIYDDRKSLADIIESEGGKEKDDYFDDRFGRDGGNTVINSFDFYEKHEVKDGHLSIEFLHLYFSSEIKPLKIIIDNGFKKIPDTNIKYINYGALTETYYQITSKNKFYFTVERNKEIDIDDSFLFDSKNPERKFYINSPNPIEKYTLNKIKSLSIECLDNCKRILSFDCPFYAEEYTLELKTKDRDFYIAICRDDKIEKITIGGKEFEIKDDNKINKNISFKEGNTITVEIIYKDEYSSLMNILTKYYIKTFIINEDEDTPEDERFMLNPSSNKIQEFNFKMPAKDVFLPLLTENYYILTVFREEKSTHISSINTIEWKKLPFIKKFFWDNPIELKIEFGDYEDDGKQQFYCLDKNFMISQFAKINVLRRDQKDFTDDPQGDSLYPDGWAGWYPDRKDGFEFTFQKIKFDMPDNDLTLYCKEMSILRELTLKRDSYQFLIEDAGIKGIEKCFVKNIENENEDETILFTSIKNDNITLVYGEEVGIFIKFLDLKKKLDLRNLYGQIIPYKYNEPGIISNEDLFDDDDIFYWQYFSITMPTVNTTLYLRWEERYFYFIIDYDSLVKAIYTIDDGIENQFNNNLKLFFGDKIDVKLEVPNPFIFIYNNGDEQKQPFYKINNSVDYILYEPEAATEGPPVVEHQEIFKYNVSEKALSSIIKSNNLYFKFELLFPTWAITDSNYFCILNSFPLTKGIYCILLAGAKGGSGNSSGGDGRMCCIKIRVEKSTTIFYSLGANGQDGGGWSGNSGSGGGGGGSSLFYLKDPFENVDCWYMDHESYPDIIPGVGSNPDTPVTRYRSKLKKETRNKLQGVFCYGGNGGSGRSGDGLTPGSGGNGGPGGNINTGNGTDGQPGQQGPWGGSAGGGGTGGNGHKKSILTNVGKVTDNLILTMDKYGQNFGSYSNNTNIYIQLQGPIDKNDLIKNNTNDDIGMGGDKIDLLFDTYVNRNKDGFILIQNVGAI